MLIIYLIFADYLLINYTKKIVETFPDMVVNCEVKFDNNPNAIFFAGQVGASYFHEVYVKTFYFLFRHCLVL